MGLSVGGGGVLVVDYCTSACHNVHVEISRFVCDEVSSLICFARCLSATKPPQNHPGISPVIAAYLETARDAARSCVRCGLLQRLRGRPCRPMYTRCTCPGALLRPPFSLVLSILDVSIVLVVSTFWATSSPCSESRQKMSVG